MTRFAVEIGDRLIRNGRDFRFDGRRNESLDFCDDRAGERIVLTDMELAAAVAQGDASLEHLSTEPIQGSCAARA